MIKKEICETCFWDTLSVNDYPCSRCINNPSVPFDLWMEKASDANDGPIDTEE